MKRTICLLLALLTMTALCTACTTPQEGTEATTASETGGATVAESGEVTTLLTDTLPDIDMNKFNFRILSRQTEVLLRDVWADDMTGETVNDAVYERNNYVESKYNFNLNVRQVSESPASTLMTAFTTSVLSGTDEFDLCLDHMMYVATESLNGSMYDWTELTNTDLTQPWWHQSLIEQATYNDKLFFSASDYCISSTYFTWLMIFNPELCKNRDIDVYSMVNDGTWTIDNFLEITKNCYEDTDGSGIADHNDTYGFVTHYNTAVANWMFALDQPVTSFDKNGEIVLELNCDKMISIVEKMYGLLFDSNRTLYYDSAMLKNAASTDHDVAVTSKFASGTSYFTATRIFALDHLRDSSVAYGIVPFPKYDEAQEGYYSHVDGRASVMFIPNYCKNEEYVSAVIEAMSLVSYQDVMPAIESAALLGRYSSTEDAYKMVQLTLAGRVYAFSYLHRNSCDSRLNWMLTRLMSERSSNFASAWKSVEKSAAKEYKNLLKRLAELG